MTSSPSPISLRPLSLDEDRVEQLTSLMVSSSRASATSPATSPSRASSSLLTSLLGVVAAVSDSVHAFALAGRLLAIVPATDRLDRALPVLKPKKDRF